MPIRISIIDDFTSIFRGTKRLGEAFDDVADSIDDMVQDGKADATRLERSFSDTFREIRRDAKAKTDDIADDTRRNMSRAGGSTGDFKREALQNLSETASSFDGSMDDIAGMVQGTFGGLADLPGVGVGVAALGALGGVVYNLWKADAERLEERTQAMFDALVESGNNYLTQTQVQAAMKELYDDDGQMDAVRSAAETLGMSVESVATAYVTAGGARDEVQRVALERIAEEQAAIEELRDSGIGASRGEQEAIGHSIKDRESSIITYQNVIDMINGQADAEGNAAARAEEYRRAVALAQANVRGEYESTRDTQATTTQAAIDGMRDLANAINGVPQVIPVTADTTALDRELAKPRTVIVGVATRGGQAVV